MRLMRLRSLAVGLVSVAPLTAPLAARAQTPETDPAGAQSVAAEPHGILSLEDYSGGLGMRRYLLGDPWGWRSGLAAKGVSFQVDWTQVVQSVVDGGRDTTTKYGGGFDYLLNFDLDRMGAIPGGLVKFRAETRYGLSVNGDATPLAPVNLDAMFPLTDSLDEGIPFTITSLNYTQFFSPHFAVVIGKVDTLDGDLNEFASGRGVGQFMNSNFVVNGVFAVGLPYSTLAVGAAWFPNPRFDMSVTVGNASDSSTTSGFDDFGEGYLIATEAHYQYRVGRLPGGVTAGGFYVGDSEFPKFGARLAFRPGEGLVVPTDDSMWCLYANMWQYLYVKDRSDAPIKLTDGMADRQGIGFFARAGISDADTDPAGWSLSGGLGGRGMVPGRDDDTFGLGYFYNHLESGRFLQALGVDDHVQGLEAFYNIAITPAARLTLDVQYVQGSLEGVDPATVLGLRLAVRF